MTAERHADQSLIKKRMEVVFLCFIGVILALGLRLSYIQCVQGSGFIHLATRQQSRVVEVEAQRGRIRDRLGGELATDVLGEAIALNPRLVKDPAATVDRLAELL